MTIQHFYEHVPGNSTDIIELYRDMVANAVDGARFVELGAFKGKSASFMAVEILNSGKRIKFDVVDMFEEAGVITRNASHPYEPATYAEFMENTRGLFHGHGFSVYPMSTLAAAHEFARNSLDFVFVDADHSYDAVKADVAAWLPKVKPGGILAGHDYIVGEYPGVVQAALELSESNVEVRGICWVYRKPAPAQDSDPMFTRHSLDH
jgi:predicted O-methyltransferase YrrM